MSAKYFSFQGKVYLAEKDPLTGFPLGFKFLGNCPAVSLAFETTTIDHKESTSCNRLTDFQLETEKKATLKITTEEIQDINMRVALRSDKVSVEEDTVTAELMGAEDAAGLEVGDFLVTKFQPLVAESLVITGKTADTDYTLISERYGIIEILVPGTADWEAAYGYDAHVVYPFFNAGQKSYYFRGELCNTAEANKKYLVELYKVQLKPTAELAIINDEIGKFDLEGAALLDEDFASDPNFGQYGRLIPIEEPVEEVIP